MSYGQKQIWWGHSDLLPAKSNQLILDSKWTFVLNLKKFHESVPEIMFMRMGRQPENIMPTSWADLDASKFWSITWLSTSKLVFKCLAFFSLSQKENLHPLYRRRGKRPAGNGVPSWHYLVSKVEHIKPIMCTWRVHWTVCTAALLHVHKGHLVADVSPLALLSDSACHNNNSWSFEAQKKKRKKWY